MTLRGASYDHDTQTLDLTKVRLSVAQLIALLILLGGLISMQAVSMWRIDEMSNSILELKRTVHELELSNARR